MKNVKEIMHGVTVVPAETNIKDTAKIMAKRKIGSVIVKKGRVYGIVTERDIITKIVALNREAKLKNAGQIMNRIITIDHTKDINDATRIFIEHDIRRLPVTRDGKIIGIITVRDLVRQKASGLASVEYDRGRYIQGSGWG